jgi:citrate synthase
MAEATLTAREAAERLGVKPQTLYAYVSRGLLRRTRRPGGPSRFLAAEVETLRARSRSGRRVLELPVESALTTVRADGLFFRGEDVALLATTRAFEEVAQLLWTGAFTDLETWSADPEAVAVAAAAQAVLPARTLPLDRLRVAAAALAALDPLRFQTSVEAVALTGRRLLAAMATALAPSVRVPSLTVRGQALRGSVAGRVLAGLGGERGAETVNAALVLLADHELSVSTLAARMAASISADPYAVVCVGLSALGGPLHAVAALAAEDMLAEVVRTAGAAQVVGARLRRGDRVPGFGHRLHPDGDPRATVLLAALRDGFAGTRGLEAAEAVLSVARERGLPPPNVDFALAALTVSAGLERGAGEAIFGIARAAGWLAHAIEEYGGGSELRPRPVYVGVPVPPER